MRGEAFKQSRVPRQMTPEEYASSLVLIQPRPEAEAPATDAAEVWAPAVAISQLSAVQLGAFRQNFGADGLAAARRLGYAALPISKPF